MLSFSPLQEDVMRPLRYSINVTLDGGCDHRAIPADEDLHGHAVENLAQADALLFGRVTYEMMEAAWRPAAQTGTRPDWVEPFARTIDESLSFVSIGRDLAMREGDDVASGMGGTRAVG